MVNINEDITMTFVLLNENLYPLGWFAAKCEATEKRIRVAAPPHGKEPVKVVQVSI